MRKDLVYILDDGDSIRAFGTLKTLVNALKAPEKYSAIWRKLTEGGGHCEHGNHRIDRVKVERAPYGANR